MLTSDLLRVRARKKTVTPQYLDPTSPSALEKAGQLTSIFEAHEGDPRAMIDDEVEEAIGHGTDFLIWRGLAKLLYDRSEFETVAEAPPVELRRAVFEASARLGPVTTPELRQQVLAEAAAALEVTPEAVDAGLYADLSDRQRLTSYKKIGAEALLHRYNLALAQAVLYKATRLEVTLRDEDPNRLRYLFQSLKFFRLMHRTWRSEEGWHIEVDGPASLFKKNRKYGLQMATFLPALALCEDWTLVAELDWQKDRTHEMTLTSDDGLVSHYQARGQWVSDEEKHFEARFAELDTGEWELERRGTLLELDAGEVLIPDYVLKHADGRVVFVEIIGFWRRSYLERRIEMLDELEGVPLVLVVSEKLNTARARLEDVPPAVVFFKTVILTKKVLAAAEHISAQADDDAT